MTTLKLDITQIFDGFDISGKVYNFITAVESAFERVQEVVGEWRMRQQGRKDIKSLSDHMLKDIGLTRMEVEYEAGKYFWQK